MRQKVERKKRFVVCVRNTGYSVALELRKIYQTIPDPDAEEHGLVRVVDESGESYLYPAKFFMKLELPQTVEAAVRRAVGNR
jgi:hypothetical protein